MIAKYLISCCLWSTQQVQPILINAEFNSTSISISCIWSLSISDFWWWLLSSLMDGYNIPSIVLSCHSFILYFVAISLSIVQISTKDRTFSILIFYNFLCLNYLDNSTKRTLFELRSRHLQEIIHRRRNAPEKNRQIPCTVIEEFLKINQSFSHI